MPNTEFKKRVLFLRVITLLIISTAVFALYTGLVFWLEPIYIVKALLRLVLFFLIPFFYQCITGGKVIERWRQGLYNAPIPWHSLRTALLLGMIAIITLHLLVDPICRLFGVDAVVAEITGRTGSTRSTIIGALLYIPLVNAFAEEAFFRGFCFRELCRNLPPWLASLIAAAMFTAYHLTIFRDWFRGGIFVLALLGLMLAGVILNQIVHKDGHILRAWVLHAMFNIAIFTVSLQFFPA